MKLSLSNEQMYREGKEIRAAEQVIELVKLYAKKGVENKLLTVLQLEESNQLEKCL